MVEAVVEAVAGHHHAAARLQVQQRLLAADQVARDRQQADRVRVVLADAEQRGRSPRRGCAAPGWCCPRWSPSRTVPSPAVEEHVGGGLGLRIEVVLDVVAANLQVADLAADDLDAALLAVADVVAVDVRLVQVDAVEEDADAAVVVDVAVGDDDVAVAVRSGGRRAGSGG